MAGVPERRVTWRQVASAAYAPSHGVPSGDTPGLEAATYFQAEAEVWTFGAVVCAVRIEPDTGYANPTGRRFFDICRADKRCEYVILGNRISNKKIEGGKVRPYTSGGHLNHVHCSGWR